MPGPLGNTPEEYAVLSHPVWDEIAPEFLPKEFELPESMDVAFLRMLCRSRRRAGVPFRILDTVRDDDRSAHGELPCCVVDLQVLSSGERFKIVKACILEGFERVGTYQGSDGMYRGEWRRDKGGVHVDASRTKPNEVMWTMRIRSTTSPERG